MYEFETKCIQSGYKPENGQPRTLPIYQSTTYKYDDAAALGKLFDLYPVFDVIFAFCFFHTVKCGNTCTHTYSRIYYAERSNCT